MTFPGLLREDFDQPNGTLIDGMTGSGGIAWADPEHVGTVVDGCAVASGNCYFAAKNLDSSNVLQPIVGLGGTFTFTDDPGPTGRPGTLIADNDSPRLQNMLHANFGLSGAETTLRKASGSFDAVSSVRYKLVVGGVYPFAMVLDQPNDKATIYYPDGFVSNITDARISDLDMRTGRIQISAGGPMKWCSFWIASTREAAFHALSGYQPISDITDIRSVVRAVAGSRTGSHGTQTNFLTYTTPTPSSTNRIKLSVDINVLSAALPGACHFSADWEIEIHSSGSANVLGDIDTIRSKATDSSGITLSLGRSFTLSGQTLTCGLTPYVGGANAGTVTGVEIDYRAEVLGNSGGTLVKL